MSVSLPGSTAGKNLVNALPSAVLKAIPGTKRIATERKRHHQVIPPPNSAASLPHSSLLRSWHTDFHPQAIAHTGRTQGGAAARRQRRAQPRARAVHAGPRTGPVPDQGGSHGTQTACYARPSSSLPLSSSRSCRSGAPASRCDRLRDHCPRTTPAIMTAEPLKPRRHLGVIQVGIIAAVGTDEFIHAVVAAVDAAVDDADRLVPQERRASVARLTGERDRDGGAGPGTQPRVTAVMGARCGDGGRTGSQSGAGRSARVARPAPFNSPPGAVALPLPGSGATMPLSADDNT